MDMKKPDLQKNVLFITVYPSPYRVDFFNEFGKTEGINLSVVFLERPAEQRHRSADWFKEDYTFFDAIFLKKRITLPGGKFLCPELISIVRKDFDEIILGGYSDAALIPVMAYLKLKKKPYSIEIDGGLVAEENRIKYYIKRILISSANKWYSSGSYSDKYLIHYGANAKRIWHFPFSSIWDRDIDSYLDIEHFHARKVLLRDKLGVVERKVVLAVGQFDSRKGFDVLLHAIEYLDSSVGVYIVGGDAPDTWKNYIKDHDLNNVHTIGFLTKDTLWEYYRAADLFVLPTRYDIWGLVINEAIANGLPVVTTEKCVAGQELVKVGQNGFLVPVDDEVSLADAINNTLKMNLYSMRLQSLDVAKEYTIENMVKAHLNALF